MFSSNEGPVVRNGPAPWGPGFAAKTYIKILKNLLLQNQLAKTLLIWYVALPIGYLPCLFN